MKRIIILGVLLFLVTTLFFGFAFAHGEDEFAEAEEIINMKTACENLSEEQLESLGDYYMEQMHPGELHEIMDERMGGEGSDRLTQVHIAMGKTFYCGEHGAVPSPMMNTMIGRGMMGGSGMMGGYGYSVGYSFGLGVFMWIAILLLIALITVIILLLKSKSKRR